MLDTSSLHTRDHFVLLTRDGWWIEDGHAVHAACDGPRRCPHLSTGETYAADPLAYVRSLPETAYLVNVLCHG
ncbi:hypothetical protein [Streptomyces sp. JJ36]|uniref:hypothetical protein n=1 Tax=Streptomyces sp. JJ36 TaxID=2736645 RepID=UPI001F2B97F4|nr:hypothetical protein [Streptomyces sp. JJ36]MCF6525029.1 hypothetical protein [Streptomyces sp. JJ36]